MAKRTRVATKGGKKLPKRTGKHHEKKVRSWLRARVKHAANREAQERREAANRHLRAQGLPTPWERACTARSERRVATARVGGLS